MKSLPAILNLYPDLGVALIAMSAMMVLSAAIMLAREWQRPRPESLLVISATLLAVIAGCFAMRMQNYVFWLGFPLLATGFSLFATRLLRGLMVPTVAVGVLISPVGIGAVARTTGAVTLATPKMLPGPDPFCRNPAAYRELAALPPGLVLADINLGPYILAATGDPVLAAPYHRMTWGILAAHGALASASPEARTKIRALKIGYVVMCSTYPSRALPGSLEAELNHGVIADWLRPVSGRGEALQIYAVRAKD